MSDDRMAWALDTVINKDENTSVSGYLKAVGVLRPYIWAVTDEHPFSVVKKLRDVYQNEKGKNG